MGEIFEPDRSKYEDEWRLLFLASRPGEPLVGRPHVIVQGSVETDFRGHSDTSDSIYPVRLEVGPYWRELDAVAPSVTINGFWNSSADTDDQQLWEIKDLKCEGVTRFGKKKDEARIVLNFNVRVRGEKSHIIRLGYYLVAAGLELGEGGLNEPGPVKTLD